MRNRNLCFAIAAVVLLCLGCAALAEDVTDRLSVAAEVRARGEGDDKDFRSDTKLYSFALLRTRLALRMKVNPHLLALIQIQDSRTMGESGLGSGSSVDDKNVGLHQGYFLADSIFVRQIYIQIGRFLYSKGNQRVFGPGDWSNVGRTWDGGLVGFKQGHIDAQLFFFMRDERRLETNDDLWCAGIYTVVTDPNIDFLFVWDRDNRVNSDNDRYLDRFTVGLYRHGEFSEFDYTSNLAYQFGKTNYKTMDISAYLITLDIGYKFQLAAPREFRIGAGADITSGDDKSDDKHKTYDNLYYTSHRFRGHMDYFVSSPAAGLNDFYLTTMFRPIAPTSISLDGHYFMTNVDYGSAVDGSKTSALGEEIDLYATHQLLDNLAVQLGASMFFPSEDWKGKGADPSHWLYLQTTASF